MIQNTRLGGAGADSCSTLRQQSAAGRSRRLRLQLGLQGLDGADANHTHRQQEATENGGEEKRSDGELGVRRVTRLRENICAYVTL